MKRHLSPVRLAGLFIFAPLPFRLAFHRRCRRVLELDPLLGAPGAVARAEPLRDDTLMPHLAGVAAVAPPRTRHERFGKKFGTLRSSSGLLVPNSFRFCPQ